MPILKASHVICRPDLILTPGCVRIEGNKIIEVSRSLEVNPKEKVLDLGSAIISPGLINAHCHLEYTLFDGRLNSFQGSFVEWIKGIVQLKKTFSARDYLNSFKTGMKLALESATTCLFDVLSMPEILLFNFHVPLRIFSFLELIDISKPIWTDERLAGFLLFFQGRSPFTPLGLSPHSPYTASEDLYSLTRAWCTKEKGFVMTHVAESFEEYQMFKEKKGMLFEFISQLNPQFLNFTASSPLRYLAEKDLIGPNSLLIHLNYLDQSDYKLLEENTWSVVYCPKSHAFFGHDPFPLADLLTRKINVLLGTDSLASNDSLDMRKEIWVAHRSNPSVSIVEWWKMLTLNPAKAIGMEGKLGEIKAGAYADLVITLIDSASLNPLEFLLFEDKKPFMIMVDGNIVHCSETL
ncbi:amidohydrolase family protein [Methylacidiphilum caldifontis]|uniref:Cytosine deaminase n=1 Tax=Methylacidiphilum caldifontis TaxID=2795386 RepID=A0A4Y8PBS9_9BACT|nr:amidohydrolase family protein [Methylacidiphilum caldifontis]TFE68411.1 cytosine deaminase [Methylacidiphilum caldifontis]